MSLSEHIKKHQKPKNKRTAPVWQGPCSPEANGGITYSLLSRFLCCRERFRLHVVEGLRPHRTWNHRTGYGDFWHLLEESFAEVNNLGVAFDKLASECRSIVQQYPMQSSEVEHWYNVAKVQFPIYCEYWARHQDVVERTPLLQEQVFHVPYTLPSGRVVYLRGKWDSVDLVGRGKASGIFLKENKTKGQIEEEKIRRQMRMDLQTMLYVVALNHVNDGSPGLKILDDHYPLGGQQVKGIIYNVIRRPLSGGKGTIIRHKPTKSNPRGESKADFYGRVAAYIKEAPESYFMRWRVDLTPEDVERFRRMCLDPILEQLCDWYEWVIASGDCFGHKAMQIQGVDHKVDMPNAVHTMTPFGIFNALLEGGSTDLDGYLDNGSEVGLERVNELFPELG